MALYVDELARSGSDWGIRGLGLLPGDAAMAGALGAQDRLYSLTEKFTGTFDPRIIGSIVDYVHAPGEPTTAARVLADPQVAILSLTITESGYAEPSKDGDRTTFDTLAGCLDARRRAGAPGLTVLSCDNLPGNGAVCRRAMLAAAERHSPVLRGWVDAECSFPNSMVDRITPQTSQADRDWLVDNLGIEDRWPVVGETFRQWVMEDDFVAGRPAWEDAGVLFTDDVHSWELYKLRFLNAGHSSMAYLCALAGIVYVDEAMAHPAVSDFLGKLLHTEALPPLTEIPGHRREDYIATVLGRFANTGVRDQIARLCIDGTAKFPTFLIPTIAAQLAAGGPIGLATLALAGWARYLAVTPRSEQSFDAAGDAPREFATRALADPLAFLEFDSVFPPALRDHPRFRDAFASSAALLGSTGPLEAMMKATNP